MVPSDLQYLRCQSRDSEHTRACIGGGRVHVKWWIRWLHVWARQGVFLVKYVIPSTCQQCVVPYLIFRCGSFMVFHIGFLGGDVTVGILVGYRGRMVVVVRVLMCAAGHLEVLVGCAAMGREHDSRAVLGSVGSVPSRGWLTGPR